MVKPINGLCTFLSLMILSLAPISQSIASNYFFNNEERSHPKTSSTNSSADVMDLTINCIVPAPIIYLDQNGEAVINPYDFANPMNPNCDSIALTSSIDTVRCNDLPSVPNIEITAIDTCGNTDMCTVTIMVQDTLAPVLICPNDTIVVSPDNACESFVMLDSADVVDNCFLDTLYNSISSSNDISGRYPVGVTTVKFFAEDTYSNLDSCSFTITVQDFTNPNIVCPAEPTTPFSCSTSLPKPLTTVAAFRFAGGIVDDSCGINEASWSFREEIDDTQCPIKITRWYIVEDVNGNIDSCSRDLYLNDELISLSVMVPDDVTFSADPGLCEKTVTIQEPIYNKSCGVVVTRMPIGNTYDVGVTDIEWTITDGCGESQVVSQQVVIEDNENPSLTCSGPKNVSLTNSSQNVLSKNAFIVDTDDNCGIMSSGIHRMDGGCVPGDDTPDFEVNFCCSDVNTDVMVVVTIEDHSGNIQSCMVSVSVDDTDGPTLVEGLPDITVSCDYYIDTADLTPFGEIQFDEADREPIDIVDELYDGLGRDGLSTDNCDNLSTSESFVDNRLNNQGTIVRTITIADSDGRTVVDEQVITIQDTDVLTIDDIQFPNDTSIVGSCDASLDPDVTGEPIVNDDDICTMTAFDKEDLVFDDPDTGCRMIKRTWTVIDMSQFVPNTNQGRWTDVQYIILENNTAPTIDGCEDVVLCAPSDGCDGNGILTISASDDCTDSKDLYYKYFVDLNGDGSIDYEAESDTINEFFPAGVHKVKWKVEDRCGNLTTCEYNVTMQECKAPVPVCLNGLSVDLNNLHTAEMWASDFNNHSYDNCTSNEDLIFSFSEQTDDRNIVFDCDDKGDQQIKVYVTDETGNQSFCVTHVLITDNIDPCPKDTNEPESTFRVGGKVSTEEEVTISETLLEITDGKEAKVVYTNTVGGYMFTELIEETDYLLDASKNDQCMEGISTLDLVLIQRHILGQNKLTSPYKLIAADVNNSQTISAADLVELRKMILGVNSKFSKTDCWLFIDKYFNFEDPSTPWDYPKQTTIENLDIDLLSSDFVAVKVGDVNGSVSNIHDTKPDPRSSKMVQLSSKDIVFESGDEVLIPIKVHNDLDVIAMQINFNFDADALTFVGVGSDELDIRHGFFHSKVNGSEGNVAIAYSDVSINEIDKGDEIIRLKFIAKESNKLSAVFTESSGNFQSVIYNKEEEMHYLQYDYDVEYLKPMVVGEASPNPFVNETFVPITVAYDMPLEVTVYDQSGALVYQTYDNYKTGIHYFEVNETKLDGKSGVFYIHVAGAEMKEVKKLIKIK